MCDREERERVCVRKSDRERERERKQREQGCCMKNVTGEWMDLKTHPIPFCV